MVMNGDHDIGKMAKQRKLEAAQAMLLKTGEELGTRALVMVGFDASGVFVMNALPTGHTEDDERATQALAAAFLSKYCTR